MIFEHLGYNFSAIMLLSILLILHFIMQRDSFTKNNSFFWVIVCALVSTICNSLHHACVMLDITVPWLMHLITYILLFSNILQSFFVYYDVLMLTGLTLVIDSTRRHITSLPVAIAGLLIFTNPLTGLIISFDETNDMHLHPGAILIFAIGVYYIILSLYYLIQYGPSLKKQITSSIIFMYAVSAIAGTIQYMEPEKLIFHMAVSLGILAYFISTYNTGRLRHSVTGLHNRYAFTHIISLCHNLEIRKTFILIHVEDVSLLNKKFGEYAVDNILFRKIGQFLHGISDGPVYYLGDCSFILQSDKIRAEEYDDLTNEILAKFNTTWNIKGSDIMISAITGVFSFPEDSSLISDIFEFESYIHRLKSTDSHNVLIRFNNMIRDIHESQQYKHKISMILNNAFRNPERFEVMYQPVYSTIEGKCNSAEALLRINDPENGIISAAQFMKEAEENGMILNIGAVVLDKVCRFFTSKHLELFDIDFLSVNLSLLQCMDENLFAMTTDILQKTGINPNSICFEITESAIERTTQMLRLNMAALHNEGIRFTLDNFGTGYFAIERLLEFPFESVKLSPSLLRSAFSSNPKGPIALNSTLSMLQELNLSVTAKGVETSEESDHLNSIGMDGIQGHYYSKPLSGEEFIAFLNDTKYNKQ